MEGRDHILKTHSNITTKISFFLTPRHQSFIKEKINSPLDKPAFLVMHGGSGSTKEEIGTAVSNGVIKMNVDTDTQWAYWTGLKDFYEKNKEYLQGQVGFKMLDYGFLAFDLCFVTQGRQP